MTNQTEERVVRQMIGRNAICSVARDLNIPHQLVRYHVQALIKGEYLRKIRGTRNPALYEPTKKPYPFSGDGQIPTIGDGPKASDLPPLRGHLCRRDFRVLNPPTKPWPWEWTKEWESGRKGSTKKSKFHSVKKIQIDTIEGPIRVKSIQLSEGPKGSTLTIWMEDYYVYTQEQRESHAVDSTDKALLISREIQKRSGTRLGLVEEKQKPEYAMPIPRQIAKELQENGALADDEWIDHSISKDQPEAETNNPLTADSWSLVRNLKSILDGNTRDKAEIKRIITDHDDKLNLLADDVVLIVKTMGWIK